MVNRMVTVLSSFIETLIPDPGYSLETHVTLLAHIPAHNDSRSIAAKFEEIVLNCKSSVILKPRFPRQASMSRDLPMYRALWTTNALVTGLWRLIWTSSHWSIRMPWLPYRGLDPLLLTLVVNFISSQDKWAHPRIVRGEISYPFVNFNGCWTAVRLTFGSTYMILFHIL